MNNKQPQHSKFDINATIYILAAVSDNGVIGYQQKLPWHIPEDLQWFKQSTMGKALIMGHATHRSIGRPLPKRTNIVLTHDRTLSLPGCTVAHSWQQAFDLAGDEVAVIGGTSLYAWALQHADYLCLTHVQGDFQGDCFFPDVDWQSWHELSKTAPQRSCTGVKFTHAIYQKTNNDSA